MALDQSALTDLLDALRSGGDLDFMREAMQLVLQALIDLESTHHIGAARYERSDPAPPIATAVEPGCCRPRPATWSWPFPSCAREASSPPCWSLAGASIGPCGRWSWRPSCMACRPARSMAWSPPWASTPGCPRARSLASVPTSTAPWPASPSVGWTTSSSPTCSSTPPTSRPTKGPGWCPRPSSWPPG
jgi:hypothetical protein